MTEAQVRARLEQEIRRAGSASRLARALGMSLAYVSDVRHGGRAPGPVFLHLLGRERVVTISTDYCRRPRGQP